MKLAGEAGAIIAKTAAEGHFIVKLTWVPGGRG
ncbi:MAG TPA: CU044_2847 family protein [Pseudonocardiaceae bacterium]|nr:CU044_2847 family protein [Pseudonocardiaceae bacterium]